jgi:DNA-binding NarL/FixJ family response regulator
VISTARIRVLLADDHTLVRQGLRALLEREADIKVIGEATNGREVIKKAEALRPDIVVMDVSMPRLNGIEATQKITTDQPDVRVVVLSMHAGEDIVKGMLRAGASGYVLKDAPANDLLSAIRAVAAGGCSLHPRVSRYVIEELLKVKGIEERVGNLTPREIEVVRLIVQGMTNKEIASHLRLSVKTVEAHRTATMKKLDLHSVAELIRWAMRHGLVTPD